MLTNYLKHIVNNLWNINLHDISKHRTPHNLNITSQNSIFFEHGKISRIHNFDIQINTSNFDHLILKFTISCDSDKPMYRIKFMTHVFCKILVNTYTANIFHCKEFIIQQLYHMYLNEYGEVFELFQMDYRIVEEIEL